MPVSSSTEHWIKPDALTINLNHFGDPDYLQVSVLAGAVVMAFKQDVIGYNASHNYRTWPLQAANTYLETTSAYHVYARLTRSEVNASALIVYDPVLRDIEGREITFKATGSPEAQSGESCVEGSDGIGEGKEFNNSEDSTPPEPEEILGEPDPDYFYVYLGKISASINASGYIGLRIWETDFRFGTLNTNQYQNEEGGGEFSKMFKLNKVTDLIEVLKVFSSAIFKKISTKKGDVEKSIVDIKRSVDSDDEYLLDENGQPTLDQEGNPILNPEYVPISDETIPTTAWIQKNTDGKYIRKDVDDRSVGLVASDKGFETGQFVTGMVGGRGAKMFLDENGKSVLEIDKIHGREELVVPVITFNTIEVVSGDKANTFAYGVIKEVDTERCIASLDLLVEEYGTLKEYDILRGVFHNINGGNDTETKEDANGFLQYSGFFTSYFTPYEILTHKAGEMSFRYSLQDGTTRHPCAGMKFFAYGNFVDKDRQSITYENRDYKRRLVKMDSWVINPTKNIAMQDGKLDNLNIGGFTMSGYGTFQTNSYFTGAMIEFTPDQLENLKGEDSYSVSLSSYEGIVKVDVEGNVTNGLTSEMNVVTGSMNVVTGDKNVVTTTFALKTTVQASRGSVPLFYSNEVVKGGYLMSITPIGCKAVIRNGSVVVTDIYDLANCYVDITINCEGKYPIDKRYTITGVYDGQSSEVETIYSKEKEPKAPADVHPYEDDEVWNHEASEENIWMAMATKKNDEWNPWQVTRIKGFDAFEYKVLPETTSIGRTMTGSLSPNAIHLACYRIEQGKRTEVNATWLVQRWKSEAEGWVNTDYTNEGTSIDFVFPTSDSMDNGWKQYRFVAVPEEVEDTEAVATATILDEGKNGQIARYCGVFKEGKAYVWDEDYRDIVVYNGDAYQVKSFGSTVTESPAANPGAWNEASKFDFVAMDTALINGANIAGFTFTVSEYRDGIPYGVLASANNDIVLDAATGKLSCKGASVDGDFNVGSIAFKTRSTQGSLEGYSLGLGGHLFALPTLEPNQNMELRVLYPSVDSRVPQGVLSVYVPEGSNASIVVPDESEAWAKFDTSVGLYPNILYTIFGYCDYKGYTQWYIGGSYGSTASVPIKTNVDKSVVEGSNNPVSGGAVYTALQNKIQEISTDGEATDPNVLYVITDNQG